MKTAVRSPSMHIEPLEDRTVPATLLLGDFVQADGTHTQDFFGQDVAIFGDYAVVGALRDDSMGANAGAAYVYHRVGDTWFEQAKLTAPDAAAQDFFGVSVAISGDRIVVGSIFDDPKGNNSGSAYVFRRDGENWTYEAKITAKDGSANDWFGVDVAIDGDTIVVGASMAGPTAFTPGAAYVYHHDGTKWKQVAKLTASDGADDDFFGNSVSISGNTIVVGTPWKDRTGSNHGAAYVYQGAVASWTEIAKLTAVDGAADDEFGSSVSVDGDTIVVGAPKHDVTGVGFDAGQTYVFARSGGIWTLDTTLTASDASEGAQFGYSVSVSESDLLIGARYDAELGVDAGAAYLFSKAGGAWAEVNKLLAANGGEGALFGWSVAVAGDYYFVGSPNAGSSANGLAYYAPLRLPTIVDNGATVPQGESVTINVSDLAVTVPGRSASEIIYTVLKTPVNGTLLLNGVALTAGDQFSQADIDAGRLTYLHDGSETSSDAFDFEVFNTSGNELFQGTFSISVILVPPAPPGPDQEPVTPITLLFAPSAALLTRPELGLAFRPPFPDDLFFFDPSLGPIEPSRRNFTGEQALLQAAAVAARTEESVLHGLPSGFMNSIGRVVDGVFWPSAILRALQTGVQEGVKEEAAPEAAPNEGNPGQAFHDPRANDRMALDVVFTSAGLTSSQNMIHAESESTGDLDDLFAEMANADSVSGLAFAALAFPAVLRLEPKQTSHRDSRRTDAHWSHLEI
ncbi:MAG: cadherin-like domain-containing protein [Planctomycetota bacterium]